MQSLIKQDKDSWEREYQQGAWTSLASDAEFAHYSVVASYIQRERRPVRLLDVGCGEGVILRYLNLDSIASYTGVDLAQAALDRLTPKRAQDRLICSSLEEYTPEGRWDVILFNEVLYYTHDPVREVRKFEQSLNPGGWFVVSMYQKRNPLAYNNRCLRRVRAHFGNTGYEITDAVEIRRFLVPCSWVVFMVRPPAR